MGPLRDSRIEVAGGRELVAKSRSTRRRRTYRSVSPLVIRCDRVHCRSCYPNFRDITWNVEINEIGTTWSIPRSITFSQLLFMFYWGKSISFGTGYTGHRLIEPWFVINYRDRIFTDFSKYRQVSWWVGISLNAKKLPIYSNNVAFKLSLINSVIWLIDFWWLGCYWNRLGKHRIPTDFSAYRIRLLWNKYLEKYPTFLYFYPKLFFSSLKFCLCLLF